jgi:hypothetical protein
MNASASVEDAATVIGDGEGAGVEGALVPPPLPGADPVVYPDPTFTLAGITKESPRVVVVVMDGILHMDISVPVFVSDPPEARHASSITDICPVVAVPVITIPVP